MGYKNIREMGEAVPVVNHYLEAEQWKARLNKEDVAYYQGRELRQKATNQKVKEFNERGTFRAPSTSRPPTGVSSVCFDGSISRQSTRSSCHSVSSSQFGAQLDRIAELEV